MTRNRLIILSSFLLVSCAGVAGSMGGAGWLFCCVLLFSACTSTDTKKDAISGDTGGIWESCCVDGEVDQCWCPTNMACNYGQYTVCDGVCSYGGEPCDPTDVINSDTTQSDVSEPDATEPDVSEPDVSEPDATEPDVSEPDVSEPDVSEPDVSEPDMNMPDGNEADVIEADMSEPDVSTPMDIPMPDVPTLDVSLDAAPDVTPDMGPDVIKDNGSAVDAGCDGNWESCCTDGLISTCCCPTGVACNYGMYEDCGDGTCANAWGDESCP